MKGFLSSLTGVLLVLLFSSAYVAWMDTGRVYTALNEYVLTLDDVYRRAALEDLVYDTVSHALLACGDPASCEAVINAEVTTLLLSYGIEPPCPTIFLVVRELNRNVAVVSCPVEGRIGRAVYKLPLGARVP